MENERKWKLYIHKSPSGKFYVGITSTKPNRRWQNGEGYKHNIHFYNAINKYGWDNFEHIILRDNLTAKEAKDLEIKMIAILKSNNADYGYNITTGGDGVNGLKHTEETKRRISEANKGENNPNYGRTGEKSPMYGKHHTEEAKRKMSEAKKGENSYLYGKHHTEETKRKISESLKGENNPWYGKPLPEETRQKISESLKGRFAGENHPFYGKHHSEETRRKISENHYDCSGENNPLAKAVICIETNKYYGAAKEAAEETGIDNSNIMKTAKGKRKTAGGYHWRYATEEEIKAKRSLARAVNEHAS